MRLLLSLCVLASLLFNTAAQPAACKWRVFEDRGERAMSVLWCGLEQNHVYRVQVSSDLKAWQTISAFMYWGSDGQHSAPFVNLNNQQQFMRLVSP